MGDIASYEARVKAKIDLNGKDDVEKRNIIEIYFNSEDDIKEDFIKEVEQILSSINEENINGIYYDYNDSYLDKADAGGVITKEKIREFLEDTLEGFGLFSIEHTRLEKVDAELIEKIQKEGFDFSIINRKIVINFSEIYNSIYCETDNSTQNDIDVKSLSRLFQIVSPEKIEMVLEGDGYGYC